MPESVPASPRPRAGPGRRLAVWIATGFGLGYSPFAPGTVGSLWGVAIVVAVWPVLPSIPLQIALGVVLSLLAIGPCGAAEQHFGVKDPGRIVADEYLTFPLCMIGLPVTGAEWWVLPMAFCSCRFFDIVKPPPARRLQNLHGGLGIVIDDVFASLYSLAANHLGYWVLKHWIG